MAKRKRRCPPGHHWDAKRKRCVKTEPKHPKPTTTTTTQPADALEPVAGTVTPAVAQAGDTGTTEAPPGGDLTGTAQIQDAVFGAGPGYVPQYHDQAQAETPAQGGQPEGGG